MEEAEKGAIGVSSYNVLVHKKVAKNLKDLPEIHTNKFVGLIDVLTSNPFPWKQFDLKKIEGSEIHTELDSVNTGSSIMWIKDRKQFMC